MTLDHSSKHSEMDMKQHPPPKPTSKVSLMCKSGYLRNDLRKSYAFVRAHDAMQGLCENIHFLKKISIYSK